jgi:DNA-binding CsgD family transcriptional regulator
MAHETDLTPREREVFALAARGQTNKQIATELGISRNAVRYHLKEIHSKLETGSNRSFLARHRVLPGGAWLAGMASRASLAASLGVIAVALGLMGVAAYLTYPGGGSAPSHSATPDSLGRYPNGCPALVEVDGTLSLAELPWAAASGSEEVARLNPTLPRDVPLPRGTTVLLPYVPQNGCERLGPLQMTPPAASGGTPPARGTQPSRTTPASARTALAPTPPQPSPVP